jgi:hypothetical protein
MTVHFQPLLRQETEREAGPFLPGVHQRDPIKVGNTQHGLLTSGRILK